MTEPDIQGVELDTFPDPLIAEMIVGFLKDAGIPAYVRGAELEDPVATSQRAMQNLGCRVFVPEASLKEALAVLDECRDQGKLKGDDGAQD